MSACTCQGHHTRKVEPGKITWFWRALSRPSELCEGGAYESSSRYTTTTSVICLRCLNRWRTKARYAEQLREPDVLEMCQIKAGIKHTGEVPDDRPLEIAARTTARQHHVDYRMRAAGDK